MLSDEEKKAIEKIKKDDEYYDILENIKQNKYNMWNVEKLMRDTTNGDYTEYEIAQSIIYLVNLIEKQEKEIEHLKEKRENQKKELAILNKKQIEFNKLVNTVNSYKGQFKKQEKEIEELKQRNWFNSFSKEEMEESLGRAFKDGVNLMKDKIKAKIEEYEKLSNNITMQPQIYTYIIEVLQSLLEEKE